MEHEISGRAAFTASGLPAFLPVMAHGGDNGVGDNGTDAGFTRGDHVTVARAERISLGRPARLLP
jgi:hypothetical protein